MDQGILRRLSAITEEEQNILSGRHMIDRSIYMEGDRDIITGAKLLEPGKLIAIRPHTRFAAFPEHTHDYVEMVYMCSGSTVHTVNGNRIVLGEGDLLILGQNARQSIEPAGEGDIAVNFIIRPEFFTGTLSFLGEEETPLRRFVVNCLTGKSESGYLLFKVAGSLPVQNLIENMLYALLESVPNKRGILQRTMGLLFTLLVNDPGLMELGTTEQNAAVKVLAYIEENYRQGSLTEIAEALHYDVAALSRLVKQKTGKSYTEHLQEKRLSQAAWLLKNTGMRVDDAARNVGYENISYFHRIFAERFGMSPKKYRDCK